MPRQAQVWGDRDAHKLTDPNMIEREPVAFYGQLVDQLNYFPTRRAARTISVIRLDETRCGQISLDSPEQAVDCRLHRCLSTFSVPCRCLSDVSEILQKGLLSLCWNHKHFGD